MRLIHATKIQKLSLAIMALLLVLTILLIYGSYTISILIFLLVIALFRIWYRELGEELIIYRLRVAGGKLSYENIVKEFARKGESSLNNLRNKGFINIEDDIVELSNKNHPCSFIR